MDYIIVGGGKWVSLKERGWDSTETLKRLRIRIDVFSIMRFNLMCKGNARHIYPLFLYKQP